MLNAAIDAAKKGGEILAKYFEMTELERELKEDRSFVTKADKEAEAAIVAVLKKAHPDHGIVGEEGAAENGGAEYLWIVDPLDGTKNFMNGIPLFAVSIALVHAGEVIAAVVYNPITHSTYAAEKGKGATFNGKPSHVSSQVADMGIVTIGPGQRDKNELNTLFGRTEPFFKSKRYLGATALELAYIARGGTEGFVCLGLKKWDYAAGTLLVMEAGGTITDFEGNPWNLEQSYFVASNGVAHEAMLKLVRV